MAYGDSETEKPTMKKATMTRGKMTDKQKADLKKHMDAHKKKGMSASEMKSHRMRMMAKMRGGLSVAKAHKAISSK